MRESHYRKMASFRVEMLAPCSVRDKLWPYYMDPTGPLGGISDA